MTASALEFRSEQKEAYKDIAYSYQLEEIHWESRKKEKKVGRVSLYFQI